jgi:hypothetical protein
MKVLRLALAATLGLTACTPPAQQNREASPSHYDQLASLPYVESYPSKQDIGSLIFGRCLSSICMA